jgi:hypothetical protein
LLAWCCCRGGALLLHLDIQGPTLTNLSRSGEAAIQMSSTEKQSNSFEVVCIRLNAIVNLKAAQDLFNASRVPTPFSISQGKIWDQQVDPREIAQTPNAGTKRIIWHSHHIVRHIPDWLRASRSPEYQCRHGTARKRNWKSRRSTRIRQMVRSHQSLRSIPNWLCAVCSFSSPMLEIQIAAWQWHVALHNA